MVLAQLDSQVRRRARRLYCTSKAAAGTDSKEVELYVDYQEAKSRIGEDPSWTSARADRAREEWCACRNGRLRRQ